MGGHVELNTGYALYDGLGSTVGMVDGRGALTAKQVYSDWGVEGYPHGVEQPFRYTGRWGGFTDEIVGDVLNWNRWYAPEMGRWDSRDPIGIDGGLNNYGYVENMPSVFSDDEGLKKCKKNVHMTSFGSRKGDNVGTKDNPLKPGDIAVGHWGEKQHPKKGDKWALPFGTQVMVYPDDPSIPPFKGTVADVGAFDKKHPEYAPDGWIDIYDPDRSKKKKSTKGYIVMDVPDNSCCPSGWAEQ